MSRRHSRRAVLAGGASAVLGGLAGCFGQGGGSSDPASMQVSFRDWLVAPELTPGITGNKNRVYRFEYIPGGFLSQTEQDRIQVEHQCSILTRR
ncbi:MAG: hypothetical protein J07HX5_00513, partial [halophilic archaeon J07HX5]